MRSLDRLYALLEDIKSLKETSSQLETTKLPAQDIAPILEVVEQVLEQALGKIEEEHRSVLLQIRDYISDFEAEMARRYESRAKGDPYVQGFLTGIETAVLNIGTLVEILLAGETKRPKFRDLLAPSSEPNSDFGERG